MEYQTNETPIDFSGVNEILPNELSSRYFQNLDAAMRRGEKVTMDRTLGDLGDRGFLRSGDTFSAVAENVLGPSQERRNAVMLPELQRAAGQGREERLQGVAFDRSKEMAKIEHQYRLEELDKQAQIRRMLMELEDSMSGGGEDWAGLAGQVVGMGVGSMAGGFGASIGGGLGKRMFSGGGSGGMPPQFPGGAANWNAQGG